MSDSFRTAPHFDRRLDLIEATLDCIADLGLRATTGRTVTSRIGVSNGLIRHHFSTMHNLIVAAYHHAIELLTRNAIEAIKTPNATSAERLSLFIAASLKGPVADPRMVSLWATFISQVPVDEAIAKEHREGYVKIRRLVEPVLTEILRREGREVTAREIELLAIAINGLIDGLWIEGCLADTFEENEQIHLALRSVEALLQIQLPNPEQLGAKP